jgi:hypothetical protein
MSRFAESTSVPSDRSRAEIEKTLTRYGASSFMYGTTNQRAIVAFEMMGRRIKFGLPMPSRKDDAIALTDKGRLRSAPQQEAAFAQAIRQRWRALALVIKAKLEAVECGITEFEEEFLSHIVLPNGSTVGQFMLPQVAQAYASGNMPPLLEGPRP